MSGSLNIPGHGFFESIAYAIRGLITKAGDGLADVGERVPHVAGAEVSIGGLGVFPVRVLRSYPALLRVQFCPHGFDFFFQVSGERQIQVAGFMYQSLGLRGCMRNSATMR
jgi:hypothetical protein